MMKKIYRVKKQSEIDAIFKKRQYAASSAFVVNYINESSDAHFRFAISIGKKYGNAVNRNLIKRQIRAIIHKYKDQIKPVTFVIVVKPSANTLSFTEIEANIIKILEKAKLMEKTKWIKK